MTVTVRAYPYAAIYGTIEVPEGTENIDDYVYDNFGDISFGEPDLDFKGAEYELYAG